jgi:16S rRNA (guanine(966)-N(2))-methyltransferase RsmD
MRVISGIYKGRKLKSSQNLLIRPTTDRVKEYIFNILQNFPVDKVAVDIFSGSGSLGIESLSRGAKKVFFVDNSNLSLNVLKNNLKSIQIPDEKYQVLQSDAIKFAQKNSQYFDLYFLDPPFKYSPLQILLDSLFKNAILTTESIVILEYEISNPIDEKSKFYEIIKKKKFGRSIINFLVKKGHHAN